MKKFLLSLTFTSIAGFFSTDALATIIADVTAVEISARQQAGEDKGIYTFYPKKQKPVEGSDVIVDAVVFAPDRTVVTLFSVRSDAKGARIRPETILRCHLKGGETFDLAFQKANGISTTSEYQQLQLGMSFTIYFPAVDPAVIPDILKVDFLEDPTGELLLQFNIFDIQLNRKRMIVE